MQVTASIDRRGSVRRPPVDDQDVWARRLAAAVADVDGQPERICRLCVDTLGIAGAGISMLTSAGRREVVCVTDEVAARIEGLQSEHDEGPSVDAIRGGSRS